MVKKRRGLAEMLRDETQRLEQSPEETDSVSLLNTEDESHRETESVNLSITKPENDGMTDSEPNRESESGSLLLTESAENRLTESVNLKEPESVILPIYQRMVRKEARLHEAQYDELTRLARDLNRRKRQVGEIITANTLLRVATELLLQRRAELKGDTEDELLHNLRQPT